LSQGSSNLKREVAREIGREVRWEVSEVQKASGYRHFGGFEGGVAVKMKICGIREICVTFERGPAARLRNPSERRKATIIEGNYRIIRSKK